jgi:hypothetical protein
MTDLDKFDTKTRDGTEIRKLQYKRDEIGRLIITGEWKSDYRDGGYGSFK